MEHYAKVRVDMSFFTTSCLSATWLTIMLYPQVYHLIDHAEEVRDLYSSAYRVEDLPDSSDFNNFYAHGLGIIYYCQLISDHNRQLLQKTSHQKKLRRVRLRQLQTC